MKLIRFLIRAIVTWSLLFFLLGVAVAASPKALKDIIGILIVGLFAGGLASMFIRRPAAKQTPAGALDTAATVSQGDASTEVPGARGARAALRHPNAGSDAPATIAVSYRGEIKAYVTLGNWHPVGAFAELGADDPEYRLVALMSVYAQEVLLATDVIYTEQDAIAYALGELVPHEMLEHDMPNPARTAVALGLPDDVLTPQNLHALRNAIADRNAARDATPEWEQAE